MTDLHKTREDVIDIKAHVDALVRKSQCRAVNCDIISMLQNVSYELNSIDTELTNIIGD